MSEKERPSSLEEEARKIAEKANIAVEISDGKARNVKKQPLHIPGSTPAMLRDAPVMGKGQFLRQAGEKEWEARKEIENVIDRMPERTSDQERERIRDKALRILEGKPPAKESPVNFFDRSISPDFNYHAAKEERGISQPGRGKDAGPDTTKDPPRLPGGGQVKFTDGSKGSKFLADRNPDAGKSREIPVPVGDEKFTDRSKGSRYFADRVKGVDKTQGISQPDRAARPQPSRNSGIEKAFAQNVRDVSAGKNPPAKTEGRNAKFTDNSKGSKFLSPEYQAMLENARWQKA